jgi:hypothetical protein
VGIRVAVLRLAVALVVVVATGCSSAADDAGREAKADDEPSVGAASRVERCTERFLRRVNFEDVPKATRPALERYTEVTYCSRFERRGWVYADGRLSIDAHLWLEASGSQECAVAAAGEEARAVPCEELDEGLGPQVLDCAILHHVRRTEVAKYVAKLQRRREVRCDDGTRLESLGAGK